VIENETGLFFTPQTPGALNQAIEKFETMEWDREQVQARGILFSKAKFKEKINNFIQKHG